MVDKGLSIYSLSQLNSVQSRSPIGAPSCKESKGNVSDVGPFATNTEQASNMDDAIGSLTECQLQELCATERHRSKKRKQGLRTAMGEYIVRSGSMPLTSLAVATPGPSNYRPRVAAIKPCAPQYSIGGKPKNVAEFQSPGPGMYKIDKDIVWNDKSITLKAKGMMFETDVSKETKDCILRDVKYGNLGTNAPKHKIGKKVTMCSGPPDSLVQPVDTVGVYTPGPADYTPKSEYWTHGTEQSFALEPRMKKKYPKIPGPAEYNIQRSKERGPHWSIAARFSGNTGISATPGPGAYQLGTTIGKSVSKSMVGRPPEKDYEYSPGPNVYVLQATSSDGIKHSMTYRPFEMKAKVAPGPAEYDTRNKKEQKGPEYSCGQHCPMSYPDVLRHWKHALHINPDVAPNSYTQCRDSAKNSKPKYSMGKKLELKKAFYEARRSIKKRIKDINTANDTNINGAFEDEDEEKFFDILKKMSTTTKLFIFSNLFIAFN